MRASTKYIIQIVTCLLYIRCATVSSPPGGKKDEVAPYIVQTKPHNGETNIKTTEIEILFNKKITDNKLKEQLIITPYHSDYDVITDINRRKLIISFQEKEKKSKNTIKLQDSTTYTIQIREGLKDLTEGNIVKNPSFSFSTSSTIDTNFIHLKTVDFYTKKPLEKVLVGLYQIHDTLDPRNNYPLYYTISNKNGDAIIYNIKKNRYKLYAFTDTDKDKLYNPVKDKFFFEDTTFNIERKKDTVILDLSIHDIQKPKVISVKDEQEITINFNEGIFNYTITGSQKQKILHELTSKGKELKIYKDYLCEDTVTVNLQLQDSSINDTNIIVKYTHKVPNKFKLYSNTIKELSPKNKTTFSDSITFSFQTYEPILLHKDSIGYLIIDSVDFIPLYLNKQFKPNTANNYFTYTYKQKRKVKKYVQLSIFPKALYTFKGDTNTAISYVYSQKEVETQKKSEDDIIANIELQTQEPYFIYQFLDEKMSILDEKYNIKQFEYINLKPGNYNIRIIIDRNNNKKWDGGKLTTKLLPEKVLLYKNILKVIQNWDVEKQTIRF